MAITASDGRQMRAPDGSLQPAVHTGTIRH